MAVISGGDKLAAALKELAAKVKKAGSLDVGFLEGATYPNGQSVAQVAFWQEFGAPGAGIPPRPFFRSMVAKESSHWGEDIANLLKASDYDTAGTLRLMGKELQEELVQSIEDTNDPPLSPITLMLRKMRAEGLTITGKSVGEAARRVAAGESTDGVETKPLVQDGTMRNSVDYRVQ